MTIIHPLAVVSPEARIGENVYVGPFCLVEPGAVIGDGCRLDSSVVVHEGAVLGRNNHLFHGAVVGGMPQHLRMHGKAGGMRIGDGNTIREHVTIHRAFEAGAETVLGNDNLLMVNVHVAHDCVLGNNVIITNNAMLAGHVTVEDRAYLSGGVGVHQFCRIGKLAMVGGTARVIKDIPPFVTVDGGTTLVVGLNLIGLRRSGFSTEAIRELKRAYRLIYRSGLKWTEIMARVAEEFQQGPAAEYARFFAGGRRGFTPARRGMIVPALGLVDEESEAKTKAG